MICPICNSAVHIVKRFYKPETDLELRLYHGTDENGLEGQAFYVIHDGLIPYGEWTDDEKREYVSDWIAAECGCEHGCFAVRTTLAGVVAMWSEYAAEVNLK